MDIQKQGPQTVAFLQSEIERIQTEAAVAAVTIVSKRWRLEDCARSLIDARENSGAVVPAILTLVVATAMVIEEKDLTALQGAVDRPSKLS